MTDKTCIVCSSPAEKICSSCHSTNYCSREHQKIHWKQHKYQCTPTRVKQDEKVGRYLEATKEIKAGDVVIRDRPLITGPSLLFLDQMSDKTCIVCSSPAEKICSSCHSTNYCSREHQKIHWKQHKYQCTPTRVKQDEKVGRYLEATKEIKAGDVVIREKPLITGPQLGTPPVCVGCYKLLEEGQVFPCSKCGWPACSEECSLKTEHEPECYYIQKRGEREKKINGYEMTNTPLQEVGHVSVFDRLSMAEHNCRANCSKIFNNEGNLLLVACMPIPLGAHITVCYTNTLWGTEARRIHLSENWSFECNCDRCSDVTEFGTSYSAVKCQKKDCKGYLLPTTFILPILKKTKNPDLDNKFWICSACKDEVPDAVIQQLLKDIGKKILLTKNKKDLDACERFISYCSSYLHPNHYYMTEASMDAFVLLRDNDTRLSEDRLIWKIKLCKKLLDLLEVLAPAEKRTCGFMLNDLCAAILEAGKRHAPTAYQSYDIEARRCLVESFRLLRYEFTIEDCKRAIRPRGTTEMEEFIKFFSSALPSPLQ